MLFSKQLLFVHVPKTGGMSVSKALLEFLPRPVYYVQPIDPRITDPGIVQIDGIRHETLDEAARIAARYEIDVRKLPLILAVLRNPYEMDVSRYAYLQKGHPWDEGHNQRLALHENFETFAVHSEEHGGKTRPIQDYFLLDGRVPENLQLLRCESLSEDLCRALSKVGLSIPQHLDRDNTSQHGPLEQYYTRAAEEAVYRRYQWVFDQGYYPRLDPCTFPFAKRSISYGQQAPLEGPVLQIGPPSGLGYDLWVGPALGLKVELQAAVLRVCVEGKFVVQHDRPVTLTMHLAGSTYVQDFPGYGDFTFEAPAELALNSVIDLEVTSSATFYPPDRWKTADTRHLSFQLSKIRFVHAMPGREESTPPCPG